MCDQISSVVNFIPYPTFFQSFCRLLLSKKSLYFLNEQYMPMQLQFPHNQPSKDVEYQIFPQLVEEVGDSLIKLNIVQEIPQFCNPQLLSPVQFPHDLGKACKFLGNLLLSDNERRKRFATVSDIFLDSFVAFPNKQTFH